MNENGMNEIDRRVELGLLMDFYGPLLSERIAEIMSMYVLEDYGLSEIAQEKGISRQGVYDAVRRGESQLMELEEKLGLQRRHGEMVLAARRCRELAQRGTPVAYEEVLSDMRLRDEKDRTRAAAPLRQAEDAVVLDTSELDFEDSAQALLRLIRESISHEA